MNAHLYTVKLTAKEIEAFDICDAFGWRSYYLDNEDADGTPTDDLLEALTRERGAREKWEGGKVRQPILFSANTAEKAFDGRFNCGPGAFCAATGYLPYEAEPYFFAEGFAEKGYTNPSMMRACLMAIGFHVQPIYQAPADTSLPAHCEPDMAWPRFGVVRIQWDGPWCRAGVPVAARYRNTHWIAFDAEKQEVFDINNIAWGGWMPFKEWAGQLLPWLIEQTVPKASGLWWPTHCWDVIRRAGK